MPEMEEKCRATEPEPTSKAASKPRIRFVFKNIYITGNYTSCLHNTPIVTC